MLFVQFDTVLKLPSAPAPPLHCGFDEVPEVEKVTEAVWVIVVLSVESVAVKTKVAAVEDLTVKVATPETSVVPCTVVMVGVPVPEVFASVTVLPEIGLLLASFNVTVTVDFVPPFARTVVGDAATVDALALTEPATTLNVVVAEVRLPDEAVKVTEPGVPPVTDLVAMPDAAVAEPVPVTEPLPEVWAKFTEVELSVVTTFSL
ncbi:MAG: hypothetical protein NTZ16_12915, partial [Verrucomicrobia bacterium]|nr:hypothetical protein [Verrucomicrobiota bacterium]